MQQETGGVHMSPFCPHPVCRHHLKVFDTTTSSNTHATHFCAYCRAGALEAVA